MSTGMTPPVLGPVPALDSQVPLAELVGEPILEAGGERRVVDVASRQVQQFLALYSEPSAGRGVRVEEMAVQVVDEDGVLDPLEQGASPPLGGHQGGLGLLTPGDVLDRAPDADDLTLGVTYQAVLDGEVDGPAVPGAVGPLHRHDRPFTVNRAHRPHAGRYCASTRRRTRRSAGRSSRPALYPSISHSVRLMSTIRPWASMV